MNIQEVIKNATDEELRVYFEELNVWFNKDELPAGSKIIKLQKDYKQKRNIDIPLNWIETYVLREISHRCYARIDNTLNTEGGPNDGYTKHNTLFNRR